MTASSFINSVMPPQASTFASDYDVLYAFLWWSSLIASVLLLGGMTYFIWKYRRKSDNDKTAYITHNHLLEFLWSFIPMVIFLVMFAWGAWLYWGMRFAPPDAMEIHVTGKQWLWEIEYRTGKKLTNELRVPIDTPIKLLMTSTDVIHSFFIPSFRVKQDVVPGMYSSLWFQPSTLGEYHVFCAEYCGAAHSNMLARVKVVSKQEFHDWLYAGVGGKPKSLAEKGADLYNVKGCVACHNLDATVKIGPGFKGLFGKRREFENGGGAECDETYLREAILNSQAKIVKGFTPAMPIFQGQLEEDEVKALIEFIKAQK